MEFFVLPFQLGEIERCVLWFMSDVDGVFTENGHIATFCSAETAIAFARDRSLQVASEASPLLDLRWIQKDSLTPDNIDCVRTMNAWNFFADVATSLPDKAAAFVAHDGTFTRTYDKLFWGNNLPSVTPTGQHYEPIWSVEEVVEIQTILQCGLELFSTSLN